MDKRVPWLCSAMAIVAAACSSNPNTSGDGGTSATGSVDSACSDAANKVCNKLATCSPLILKLVYTDMNGCNGAWKAVCLSEANANGSMLTSDAVQMCGQGTDSASCSDAINSVLAGTLPGCDLHGSLPQNAPCTYTSQCSGATSYCNLPAGQLCGVCGTRVAANGKCTQNYDCQAGLLCNSMGTCVMPGGMGATCNTTTMPCATNFTCSSSKCVPMAEELNAMCDPSAFPSCDYTKGLFCNSKMVCAMVITGTPGGMCGLSSTLNYTVCPGSILCNTGTNSLTGTCPTIAQQGAPCDGSATICQAPAVCTNGMCKSIDPSACH